MSKYHNVRVGEFDSKKEARRAGELKLLQRAGHIIDLVIHPRYRIDIAGFHVCDYEADFQYRNWKNGQLVVEDCKGVQTAVYKIKKKLMRAVHGIEILET